MIDTARPSDRIAALDALRGLAVLGIVLMNVYVFALPQQAYLNPMAWGGETTGATFIWAVSFVLVEDKLRTLFAMLFGAGVAMLLAKQGRHRLRRHYARMVVLFAIGLAHAILLANNDILRGYALAGLILPLFLTMRVRILILTAMAMIALHLAGGLFAMGGASAYQEALQREAPSDPHITRFAEQNFGTDQAAVAASVERGRESLSERIERRWQSTPATLRNVAASIPVNLAAMLAGIALWKAGLLRAQWPVRRLADMAIKLALIAAPPLIILALAASTSGFAGLVVGLNALFLSEPFDLILGIAYAAAAMTLFQLLRSGSALLTRFAAAGRMSLTNYLMTSVVLATLFASWGLGWFGELSRTEVLLSALLPMALMLIWSPPWLSHFRYGPAEWLWRSLGHGRVQRMRKTGKAVP